MKDVWVGEACSVENLPPTGEFRKWLAQILQLIAFILPVNT